MSNYNAVDVCHYCNDRMYEYLKKKVNAMIASWENRRDQYVVGQRYIEELQSVLENGNESHT